MPSMMSVNALVRSWSMLPSRPALRSALAQLVTRSLVHLAGLGFGMRVMSLPAIRNYACLNMMVLW